MKTRLLVIAFVVATYRALAATPEEASLQTNIRNSGADYCYRFASWHENPSAPRFVVTFNFFREAPGPGGVYLGYCSSTIPMPKMASVIIETHARGKVSTRAVQLDAKAADEMVCRFGYSGFFATDSDDPSKGSLDGHGLTGERIYSGRYISKIRSYEDSLCCKWLYDFLNQYVGKR